VAFPEAGPVWPPLSVVGLSVSPPAYLERVVASGEYPHLTRAGGAGLIGEQDPERTFEAGLDLLIAGIAATVAAS
jgi:hypothetical protein